MVVIKTKYHPGPNTRFTEDSVKGMIGETFDAKVGDKKIGKGKILNVTLLDDGGVEYTISWPGVIPGVGINSLSISTGD